MIGVSGPLSNSLQRKLFLLCFRWRIRLRYIRLKRFVGFIVAMAVVSPWLVLSLQLGWKLFAQTLNPQAFTHLSKLANRQRCCCIHVWLRLFYPSVYHLIRGGWKAVKAQWKTKSR